MRHLEIQSEAKRGGGREAYVKPYKATQAGAVCTRTDLPLVTDIQGTFFPCFLPLLGENS